MNAKRQIPTVFVIAATILACNAFGARKLSPGLLRDGHVILWIQGQVVEDAQEGLWFFEFAEDANDMASIVKAGTRIQLLPSSILEQLAADLGRHGRDTYLLKGRVTKYKGQNYIFPEYFRSVIVLEEQPKPEPEEEPTVTVEPNEPAGEPEEQDQAAAQQEEPNAPIEDSNNFLEIPQEVLDRINSNKVIRTRIQPRRLEKPQPQQKDDDKPAGMDAKAVRQPKSTAGSGRTLDTVLTDRIAFFNKRKDGGFSFALDAYGLNVGRLSVKLLPCQALELAEMRSASSIEPSRFKIAGIRTRYKGEDYLLLQRATRIYSHGNFRAFMP